MITTLCNECLPPDDIGDGVEALSVFTAWPCDGCGRTDNSVNGGLRCSVFRTDPRLIQPYTGSAEPIKATRVTIEDPALAELRNAAQLVMLDGGGKRRLLGVPGLALAAYARKLGLPDPTQGNDPRSTYTVYLG